MRFLLSVLMMSLNHSDAEPFLIGMLVMGHSLIPLTRSLTPLARSLAPHYSLRSRTQLRFLVRSFAHLLSLSKFRSVLKFRLNPYTTKPKQWKSLVIKGRKSPKSEMRKIQKEFLQECRSLHLFLSFDGATSTGECDT